MTHPASTTPSEQTWRGLLETSATNYSEAIDSESADINAYRDAQEMSRVYLWLGAKQALLQWDHRTDPTATVLRAEVLAILGQSRKSAVSKIRRVALAMLDKDLDPTKYTSLNAAYTAARHVPQPPCSCDCHDQG